MNKNLHWKIIISVAVLVIFATTGVYPMVATYFGLGLPDWLQEKQLKLGLDLKGGVHLVLRVQSETALQSETDTQAERTREALRTANVNTTGVIALGPTQFRVDGVTSEQDAAFRQATADAEANFDRSSRTNGAYTFTMKPNVQKAIQNESIVQARQTIERRVNDLGVAEPSIAQQGNGEQILVQLPGVTDVDRAKGIISSTGLLKLTLVEQGPFPTREAALQAFNNAVPPDLEILPGRTDTGAGGGVGSTVFYVLKRAAAVSGRDLRGAQGSLDQFNRPAVSFTLRQDAAVRFGTFTQANIGKPMAIVLDDRVMSVATIQGRITDNGQITGISREEMADTVITLKSGALPAKMEYIQEQTIGPTLGADAIRAGVMASLVGLLLVVGFMLFYYKLSGVNAVVALVFNLVILLGLMAYIGAVMTLPGIAGFVLTMGIGVDSNVLIFERIKEELEHGRPVRTSLTAGFSRVFLTLLDTHISAAIAALFLMQFGTGPIRGFAYTLLIGLGSNLFTSTFVSRALFELVLGQRQVKTLSI
jgi:preprotein translocase subunit SecD